VFREAHPGNGHRADEDVQRLRPKAHQRVIEMGVEEAEEENGAQVPAGANPGVDATLWSTYGMIPTFATIQFLY
jgi:hypothetical protein